MSRLPRARRTVLWGLALFLCTLLAPHALLHWALVPWKHLYRWLHPDAPFVLYVIGGSTSVGEPFSPKISFPLLVSAMFNHRIAGRPVEICNLARSGRDLEYGYWKLEEELATRPRSGALLLYSGINDTVTQGEDPELERWSSLQPFVVLSRLQYLAEDARTLPRLQSLLGVSHNSLPKYALRLAKVEALARRYDLPVVVSTLVGNLKEFGPTDLGEVTAVLSTPQQQAARQAMQWEAQGRLQEALSAYGALEQSAPQAVQARACYRIAWCLDRLDRHQDAREYYWKAADADGLPIPNLWRNQAIRDMAARTGATLVDSAQAFEAVSPHHVMGYDLILDAHHPTLEGYVLLAEQFAGGLATATGTPVATPHLSIAETERQFAFSRQDWAKVYFTRSAWFINYLGTHDDHAGEKTARLKHYLARMQEYGAEGVDPAEVAFMECAVATAEGRWDEARQRLRTWKAANRPGLLHYQEAWLSRCVEHPQGLPSDLVAHLRQALGGPPPSP